MEMEVPNNEEFPSESVQGLPLETEDLNYLV